MLYDKDIREPLFLFLEECYGKCRIIEEKNMGESRADVILITEDAFYGVEIKSDADTYQRLQTQVKDYDRYFDGNFIACGSTHAAHIEEHVPEYWGIITIDEINGRPDFYILRQPKKNPKLEVDRKLSLLWRRELQHIVERNLKYKYERESKAKVIQHIRNGIEYSLLSREMSLELLERDYTTIAEEINQYRVEKEGKKPRRKRRIRRGRSAVKLPGGKTLKKPDLQVAHTLRRSAKRKKEIGTTKRKKAL
jgi:hypothetical protein